MKWPVGLGGKGNEGVAGMIRQMQGAIGYMELIYAVQNNIDYGIVKNAAGTLAEGCPGRRDRSRGFGKEHARRLPCFHHQRARQGRLSHFQLYLAADSGKVQGPGEGQDSGGFPELDG